MKRIVIPGILLIVLTIAGMWKWSQRNSRETAFIPRGLEMKEDEEESSPEVKALFIKERLQYELNMLKDPVTGKIPANSRQEELSLARLLPVRVNHTNINPANAARLEDNTYTPAGPNNVGGRTRAVAFDKRFNGTSNRVILSGSVSGGIFRSADGGLTWTRVNPENDIHNLTAIAQDPRPGNEDTWYAGGGENIFNSADELGAFYLGFGIWKSTNNGVTWTKLTQQVTDINGSTILGSGVLETFDNPFDFVHKIVVNPVNGDVYVAGHRRLMRSTNGGASWNVVFAGTTASTSDVGQLDIVCTDAGKLYMGVNGGFADAGLRGVWTSTTGNANSWTRIAGGSILNTDSVANWRGNDFSGDPKRIILALAPGNQNILYITYENGLDQSGAGAQPEADLFKLDAGTNTWTNLSANVPNFPGQLDGVDPFDTQFGYNLTLAVKPDDPNVVFLGGTCLFRSTTGFSNTAGTSWIAGYGNTIPSISIYGQGNNPTDMTKWSHPDIHALAFDPSNSNRAICANDGGLQITQNIMGSVGNEPVAWENLSNYQTLQYYRVAIDPGAGRNNFIGGAQDNGIRFRDATGVLGTPTNNNQFRVIGGDGGSAALAKAGGTSQTIYVSTQLGNMIRATLSTAGATNGAVIRPDGLTSNPGSSGFGEFVTNFKIDFDNTEDLYYVNFNRLFRTKNASTVTSSTWEEMTGVGNTVDPNGLSDNVALSIRGMELSRGDYAASHVLYLGTTGGRVYRLDNPRNAAPATVPVDITPPLLRDKGVIVDIAANPNNDEEVIVVASNYTFSGSPIVNIWWTNNAKSSTPAWRNAEGNLSNVSIRSCEIVVKKDASNNPVTEYYVGTSIGLYSAEGIGPLLQSGGSVTWAREGANVLNFAVISSLDYRPQDNVLLVGTHGNGMYFANVGTPDFRPNLNTGITQPTRNDVSFIQMAAPALARTTIQYRIGNMFTVKKLVIQVHAVNGQQVIRKETGYLNGVLNVQGLKPGAYILTITSSDYKQQFVKKFVKE